jgi:hypothetical protein
MRTQSYPTDLTDAKWALVAPHIRQRSPAVVHAQPTCAPSSTPSSTCSALAANGGNFRAISCRSRRCTATFGTGGWLVSGCCCIALYPLARLAAGRKPEPTLAIMDGQSMKTTERGGVEGSTGISE